MIAFNFYEPLAKLLDSTGIPWGFSDTLCMLGLFCVSLVDAADDDRDASPRPWCGSPRRSITLGRLVFGAGGGAASPWRS